MLFFFDKNKFKTRLKILRENKHITLEQLGTELQSTKSTFSNLENGHKKPSIDMLIKIADFFDVSLDYLVGRSDDPKRY